MSAREYQLGAPISLQIGLADSDGVIVVPLQVPRWRMLDQSEQELLPWAQIAPVNGIVTINLSADATALPAGELRGFRMIELEVITATGTMVIYNEILLRAPSLAVPSQSFQLYGEAAIVAESVGRLDGWRTATKFDRENALIEAAQRISRFNFGVGVSLDRMDRDTAFERDQRLTLEISELSETQFKALNKRLLKALRLAQVYEADFILNPEKESNDLRDQGVTSVKVGESSTQFTTRKRLELGVCRRAYDVLSPWMVRGTRIGRA